MMSYLLFPNLETYVIDGVGDGVSKNQLSPKKVTCSHVRHHESAAPYEGAVRLVLVLTRVGQKSGETRFGQLGLKLFGQGFKTQKNNDRHF